jgi:hypothetical protein
VLHLLERLGTRLVVVERVLVRQRRNDVADVSIELGGQPLEVVRRQHLPHHDKAVTFVDGLEVIESHGQDSPGHESGACRRS